MQHAGAASHALPWPPRILAALVPHRDALQHHSCGLMGELERARARVTKVNVAIQKISYLTSQLNHTTQAFAIHSSPSPPLTLSNTKSVAAPSFVRATHAAALVTKRSRTPPSFSQAACFYFPLSHFPVVSRPRSLQLAPPPRIS